MSALLLAEKMIDKEELLTLVPHKGKMFLLSRVISWDLDKHFLTAEYDITGDCLFYKKEPEGLPAWAGFELIAQSISVLSGLNEREKGKEPQFGFILSVSELFLNQSVLKGTVRITVEEDTAVDNVYSFRGVVFSGQTEAVLAKLTVMKADDISAVVNI
jgi:predicted hotdog family 3-hydroxylacyl-ACP dehydratase